MQLSSSLVPLVHACLVVSAASLRVQEDGQEDNILQLVNLEQPAAADDDVYQYLDGLWSITSISGGNRSSTVKTFGYSNYPHQIPITEDSHFPIGSNTKLYTAVAIYQLHEQGKLDVDADIATMLDAQDFQNFGIHHLHQPRKFCPRIGGPFGFLRRCEKITLRNLMSMSSGIYPALNCDAEATDKGQCNPIPYIISTGSIARTVGTFIMEPLIFRPGTEYHYSNPNFILAAYFVEKYSGKTFRAYLRDNIFARIGLKDSHFDFFNEALECDKKRVDQYIKYYDNTTNPYRLMSVGKDIVQLDLGVASGTGGVISTAQDYVSFWYAVFNKTTLGTPLLSASSQKAILTPWTLSGYSDKWIYPDGKRRPIWEYYTQGTGILCEEENCPNGPKWIVYTGGTYTVRTANVMDYETFRMAQVWTSTIVATTNRESFQTAFQSQTGPVISIVMPWVLLSFNNPTVLAFWKLYGINKESDSTELDNEMGDSKAVTS